MPIHKSLCKLNSFSLSSPRLAELLASAAQDGSLQKALSIGKPPDMADDEKAGICTIFWASLENTLGTSFAGSASFAVGVQLGPWRVGEGSLEA